MSAPAQEVLASGSLASGAASSARRSPWRHRRFHALAGWVLPAILLGIWQLLSVTGAFPPYLFPPPASIALTLWELAVTGELWGHLGATAARVFAGFAIGGGLALALGAAVGFWRPLERWLDPTLQAIRSVPSLAWVPLLLLWMGIDEAPKVTLIAIGAFFPVYVSTISGISGVSRQLVEVGEIYGLRHTELIRRVVIPAATPSILVGLRQGLTLGWLYAVAAEMIAAHQGLGFLLTDGREMTRPDIVIVSVLLFALCGKVSDSVLKRIERSLLRWQDTFQRSPA